MRETLADILSEVGTTPRLIQNYECLKLVADVIRFVLTLFVHEQFSDFRLLYTILDSSSLIYYLGAKKRKIYLHQSLFDHGIWSDISNWRECIQYTMKFKVDDAIRRRKRK